LINSGELIFHIVVYRCYSSARPHLRLEKRPAPSHCRLTTIDHPSPSPCAAIISIARTSTSNRIQRSFRWKSRLSTWQANVRRDCSSRIPKVRRSKGPFRVTDCRLRFSAASSSRISLLVAIAGHNYLSLSPANFTIIFAVC
jgi:hypothetical protein